ncbi:MAG TPA: ABC transporter permease [Verrucomicrobiae bacterium]|nr:ABC transporter permease [Verrucomicrobiae bacterium]
MLSTAKAELRKLLTVRSTYLIALIVLGFDFLISWWAKGYSVATNNPAALHSATTLSDAALTAVDALNLLYAIIAVLLVTHEYRYNTIMYTLTASKSRTRVFFAKLCVLSVLAIVFGAVVATLAPLLVRWGIAAHHLHLVPQSIVYSSIVWRLLFGSWGTVMLATIIAFIVRNQVGSFAVVFLLPSTVENLLRLWLRKKALYLPFSSINAVTGSTPDQSLSFTHAALVALAWIVGSAIVAWVLFLRRDAN